MNKKNFLIVYGIIVVILIAVSIIFCFKYFQPLVQYSSSQGEYEIYQNGTIKITDKNTNSSVNRKIENEELEMLKDLIYKRYVNDEVVGPQEGLMVDQFWIGTAYYNSEMISLNYNFSESNSELVKYINELMNKYSEQ